MYLGINVRKTGSWKLTCLSFYYSTETFTTVLKEARVDFKSYRSKWIIDEILSVDIKWESIGHRTQEGKTIPTIRYGYSSYCKEGKGQGRCYYNIENIIGHNDYTATYKQSDREKIVEQK